MQKDYHYKGNTCKNIHMLEKKFNLRYDIQMSPAKNINYRHLVLHIDAFCRLIIH